MCSKGKGLELEIRSRVPASGPEYLPCVSCSQRVENSSSFSSLRPHVKGEAAREDKSIRHGRQNWKDLTPESCRCGLTQLPAYKHQGCPGSRRPVGSGGAWTVEGLKSSTRGSNVQPLLRGTHRTQKRTCHPRRAGDLLRTHSEPSLGQTPGCSSSLPVPLAPPSSRLFLIEGCVRKGSPGLAPHLSWDLWPVALPL